MQVLTISLVIFFCVIGLMMLLRAKMGERFEAKNSDILLALVPIALWLVTTGKVKLIEFGGFKIESALIEASRVPVGSQATPIGSKLPVEDIEMRSKSSVGDIPRLLEKRTEALIFQTNRVGYFGPAIEEYLQALSGQSFFKYVVINQPDGKFSGLINGRDLNAAMGLNRSLSGDFVRWLEAGDTEALGKLPGYVSASDAIGESTDKLAALEKMESLDTDWLPVVDRDGKLIGKIGRSKLLSSLISEVVKKLK
jgi:CBS domain-containing protein